MLIDLQAGSEQSLTRTDGFLLLLEAQNHLMFRTEPPPVDDSNSKEEWIFEDGFIGSATIVLRSVRTLQDAMWRLRRDAALRRETEAER